MIITFYEDTHRIGETHYHMCVEYKSSRGSQKRVFMRFKKRLAELLPEGFYYTTYSSENDIGILDSRARQHAHLRYDQQSPFFPSYPYKMHNFHLDFMRPEFKKTFHQMFKSCFPKATIKWIEDIHNRE